MQQAVADIKIMIMSYLPSILLLNRRMELQERGPEMLHKL